MNGWTFCFALEREAAPFRRLCPAARVATVGMGPAAAERLPADATGIVMAGYSGGLIDGMVTGTVVVASSVVGSDGVEHRLFVPPELIDVRRCRRLLTWPSMVAKPTEKRTLGVRFGADAVDMETATVTAACAARGVPCAAVRVISDGIDDSLSPELVRLIDGGRVRIAGVLRAIALQPRVLGELLRLRAATDFAGKLLAEALSPLARLS